MEKEVSSVTRLGIMLIAMSALIGLVWVTVKIGVSFGDNQYKMGANVVNSAESSQIKSLCGKENVIMPTAAIYNMIAQESSSVSKLIKFDKNGTKEYEITYSDDNWVLRYRNGAPSEYYSTIEGKLEKDLTGRQKIAVDLGTDDTYVVTLTSIYNG